MTATEANVQLSLPGFPRILPPEAHPMWSLIRDFLAFLRQEKKWWLVPLVCLLLLLAAIIVFGSSAALAPFMYPFM